MTARRYAADTKVPVDRSLAEIRRTIDRYGGDAFGFAEDRGRAMVNFRADGRFVRFVLVMPNADDDDIAYTTQGRERSAGAIRDAMAKAGRQRWRALALVVKAKLEAVDAGITTFDEEFLAYLVMPDGSTVGQATVPAIAAAYESGKMPVALLPEAVA